MKLGRLIWFSSHDNPFAVSPSHCLDLECPCTLAWLRFREVDWNGNGLSQPLAFEVQVCLRHWTEHEPPTRPANITALVRELMVEFPRESIEQLIEKRKEIRAAQKRSNEYRLAPATPRGELVCYSDVLHVEGGLREGGQNYGFFFTHAGRDFLIEDHYCSNPDCDCRQVHIEFWERVVSQQSRRIDIGQQLMAAFTLEGELREIHYTEEDASMTNEILEAWRRHSVSLRDELEQRYQHVRVIGHRSFPKQRAPRKRVVTSATSSTTEPRAVDHVGRNDPCPCGSGRKFKRCCARQRT